MTVFFVERQDIDLVWDQCKPILEDAFRRVDCGYGAEKVKQDVLEGKRQLWVSAHNDSFAVCTTHIIEHPEKKVGVMAAGGGTNIEMTGDFIPYLENFFKNKGCTEIEMIGAPGWMRFMKRYGFKPKYIATARTL